MKSNFFKSFFLAGFIGGLVFVLLEMLMVSLFLHGSPWGPPRMIAAIVMGKAVLPPPGTFDVQIVLVALVVHFILSFIYAMVIGLVVSKMSYGLAVFIGLLGGGLLYIINFYGFTEIYPWFANARNGVTIFNHLLFGLLAAAVFKASYKRIVVSA